MKVSWDRKAERKEKFDKKRKAKNKHQRKKEYVYDNKTHR